MRQSIKQRRSQQEETFSLFPFLAVLLCTMGMLVMLLVLMSKGASKDHCKESVHPIPVVQKIDSAKEDRKEDRKEYLHWKKIYGNATQEEIQEEIVSSQWYLEELKGIKTRTGEALRKERDRLAAADRAISERLKDLDKLKEGIRLLQENKTEDITQITTDIQRKTEEIARLEKEIADSRDKLKNAKPSYSIIPYQGKSGTIRYPIYIECNERGVFLMPEGIPFSIEDFLLGKYPGNPFDMAIRTARQYIMEKGSNDLEKEPYPLLIVRPGGSDKYYAAVSALASWGGDYGYELVEEDWELNYPPVDPELAHRVQEQIALSRARLAIPLATLLAEMNRQGSGSGFGDFSSLNRGSGSSGSSLNANAGSGSDEIESSLQSQLGNQVKLSPLSGTGSTLNSSSQVAGGRNPVFAKTAAPYGDDVGLYSNNGANTNNPDSLSSGPYLAGMSGGTGDGQPLPAYQGYFGDPNRQPGNPAASVANRGTPMNGGSPPSSLQGPDFQQEGGYQQLTPYGPAVEGDHSNGTPLDPSRQLLAEVQNHGQNASSSNGDPDPTRRNWETVGNTAYQQNGTGSSSMGSSNGSPSPVMNGSSSGAGPMLSVDKKMKDQPESQKDPVAGFASSDLSGKAFNLTELTYKKADAATERPIMIECFADRIVFPKQAGIRKPEVLPTGTGMDQIQKDLFQTFVLCVKTWGVAGRNMYWNPWIKAKVHPGGEQTFIALQKIFQTQGITVRNSTD